MEVSTSFFTRKVAVAKYSAPAITWLDSEAFVEAKCIELPQFIGIDTLSFFAVESIESDSKIEDKGSTFLT